MKKELVESILDKWEISHPIIKDMYKKDSEEIERIICRISTDNQDFIIKGIPNKEESIIQSNVQAHLFLGNEHSMAPKLFPTKEGLYYIQEQGYYFYLMEYIDGRSMEENVLDEYKIGQLAHKLHSLKGYGILSPFTQSKKKYYDWFSERDFKKEFDVYGSPCRFSGLLLTALETRTGKEQGVHFCTLPNEHLDTVFRKSEPRVHFGDC